MIIFCFQLALPCGAMLEFARRYTMAWCSQDPWRVADCYSTDGSLQVNDAPPAVGREAIAAVAQSFMSAFPDMEVRMDGLEICENVLEYRWTLVGNHAATGRPVHISGCEVWTTEADGLIAKSLGHFDAADYAKQLGY